MPQNTGSPPAVETCDIRFRDGSVVRGTSLGKWRWTLHDAAYPPDYAFDIIEWQAAKGSSR